MGRLVDKCLVLEGFFKAYALEDEEIVYSYEEPNLVVNNGAKVLAHAVGDCSGNLCINEFHLGGDNSLSAAERDDPNDPQPTDTDLQYTVNYFIRHNTDMISGTPAWETTYPNAPNEVSVLFTIRIGKSEANLMAPQPTVYVAAGLWNDTNGMIVEQTFPAMEKTSNREFIFEWELRFA